MSDDRQLYQCPKCGKRLHARRVSANRKARCPACGEVHVVPSEEDPFAVGQPDLPEEAVGQPVEEASPFEFFQDAAAAAVEQTGETPAEQDEKPRALLRRCPRCGRETRVSDAWIEVVCRACGAVIPAVAGSDERGVAGDEVAAVARQADVTERRITEEPPLPGAASLLALTGIIVYVEAAVLAVGAILLLVLKAPQNVIAVVPALVGLLVAGFRAAQGQQIGQRNPAFRVITSAFDGLFAAGGIVVCALSFRNPQALLLPTALWVGIVILFVLLSAFRAYVLFHHARALFARQQ